MGEVTRGLADGEGDSELGRYKSAIKKGERGQLGHC